MRWLAQFALAIALAAFLAPAMGANPAAAFGWHRGDDLYDPYAYTPEKRRWYPYYNSGQWRPAEEMRWRRRESRKYYDYPQYNPVWGHPVGQEDYYGGYGDSLK